MMRQQVLEINLISAQGLQPPKSPRRLQTYALIWIDPSTKLRTRVDKVGGQNPTWNDKFLFSVTPEFLASETSGICVAIYAVGTFRDHLIGTIRFLMSNILSSPADSDAARTPCFTAVQIRRPSGRFHGVMNIGAMVVDASDFPGLHEISAIGYHDLMEMKIKHHRKKASPAPEEKPKPKLAAAAVSSDSCENSGAESVDEGESSTTTTSSSPSPTKAPALKEWNGVRELAGNKELTSSAFLCCLVARRNIQLPPTNPAMER